jgi:hypothetical protein
MSDGLADLSLFATAIIFGNAAPRPSPATNRKINIESNPPAITVAKLNPPNMATELTKIGFRPNLSAIQPPNACAYDNADANDRK